MEQNVQIRYKEDGLWGPRSPPPSAPTANEFYYSKKLNQGDQKLTELQAQWERVLIQSGKHSKTWWEWRKSLLTTHGNHYPLPPSCSQNTHSLSQAYPRQGWWDYSLGNLNEHAYWHLSISSNKKSSYCFITLKKKTKSWQDLSPCRDSDLMFCISLLILVRNKQTRMSTHLRKAYKMEVGTRTQEEKKTSENKQREKILI